MSILSRAKALIDQKWFRPREDKAAAYEQFLTEELKLFEERIDINLKDLAELHGYATKLGSDISYDTQVNGTKIFSQNSLLQSYCYLSAVYALFKRKGIVIHDMQIGDDKDHIKKGCI